MMRLPKPAVTWENCWRNRKWENGDSPYFPKTAANAAGIAPAKLKHPSPGTR